jgi:hypothetical protein
MNNTRNYSSAYPSFQIDIELGYLSSLFRFLAGMLYKLDPVVTRKAYRAMEWCDLDNTSDYIRHTCQNVLARQWTRRLPLLQPASPAITAGRELAAVIEEANSMLDRELEVFEFCAGSGGPTPIFERLINGQRHEADLPPVHFCISDKYPNPEAWRVHASPYLRPIHESVDAVNPPLIATSHRSPDRVEQSEVPVYVNSVILIPFFSVYQVLRSNMDEETVRRWSKSTYSDSSISLSITLTIPPQQTFSKAQWKQPTASPLSNFKTVV